MDKNGSKKSSLLYGIIFLPKFAQSGHTGDRVHIFVAWNKWGRWWKKNQSRNEPHKSEENMYGSESVRPDGFEKR
jgi:hypothetical protein